MLVITLSSTPSFLSEKGPDLLWSSCTSFISPKRAQYLSETQLSIFFLKCGLLSLRSPLLDIWWGRGGASLESCPNASIKTSTAGRLARTIHEHRMHGSKNYSSILHYPPVQKRDRPRTDIARLNAPEWIR